MLKRITFFVFTCLLVIDCSWADSPFKDKVVMVTGASKGIGKSIAKTFAEKGAKVILISRTEADLQAVSDEISKDNGEATFFAADVTSEAEMEKAVHFAKNQYGRIDVLCHNAGIYPGKQLDEMESTLWNKVINTNLNSTFYITKAALPLMKQQKSGKIILISSTSGTEAGLPGQAHYTASKAGMIGFMKTAAIELAKDNIAINAIAPGTIMTEGLEKIPQEKLNKIKNIIPMKRLGLPKEIATVATFLASDDASFITGQYIVVDGGQTLPEIQAQDHYG